MIEDTIVYEALNQLESIGIQGAWKPLHGEVDGEIHLTIDNVQFKGYAEVKRELRQYQIPQILETAKRAKSFIVIAETIFPNIKEQLRSQKIAYIDTSGNIYINTNKTYIWIDGKKAAKTTKPVTNRAFTKTGLRTVFHILLNPDAINMPHRELANVTKVGLGNVPNVLNGLKEAGFIIQKNNKEKLLQNKKALLNRWIDGYGETLKPSLLIGTYRFLDKDQFNRWQKMTLPSNIDAVWGGEAAANLITHYLDPQKLTIYTENKRILMTHWKLIPDSNGELSIYEKFWSNDSKSERHIAPFLLVYADLMLADDPRCIETADMIYKEYLQDEFEGY